MKKRYKYSRKNIAKIKRKQFTKELRSRKELMEQLRSRMLQFRDQPFHKCHLITAMANILSWLYEERHPSANVKVDWINLDKGECSLTVSIEAERYQHFLKA